jgi:hypothetical protein
LFGADEASDDIEALIAQAQPLNSLSSPLGAWSYDPGSRTGSTKLSSAFQNLLQGFQTEATQDPTLRAMQELNLLRQISGPREAETRERAREQLYSQGRLGTAAGLRELEGMEEAIQMANVSRELGALGMGYDLRQQAFSNALGLAQAPQSLAQQGLSPMSALGPAIGAGMQAAMMKPMAMTSMAQGLGTAIKGLDFGSMFSGGGGASSFAPPTSMWNALSF